MEHHFIKLQMVCAKVYLHASEVLSSWYRFDQRINILVCVLIILQEDFLAPLHRWSSHISIIGNWI